MYGGPYKGREQDLIQQREPMQQSGARQKEKKQRGDPSAASLLLALAAPLLARLAHSKNASEWENVLMLLLFFFARLLHILWCPEFFQNLTKIRQECYVPSGYPTRSHNFIPHGETTAKIIIIKNRRTSSIEI